MRSGMGKSEDGGRGAAVLLARRPGGRRQDTALAPPSRPATPTSWSHRPSHFSRVESSIVTPLCVAGPTVEQEAAGVPMAAKAAEDLLGRRFGPVAAPGGGRHGKRTSRRRRVAGGPVRLVFCG